MLLHKHNQETYQNMVELFQKHNRVSAVQPTGTGKSFLILQLIADNSEKQFLIASPSVYIFTQLQTHAVKYSVSLENCSFVTFSKLSVMSENELSEIQADYIILDEFHRCGATEWSKGVERILALKPYAKVFGTSATPIRYLDSFRNMAEELFDGNYAVNMSLAEAIRRKILPLPVYVTSWYSFSGDIARLEKRAETSENPYFRRILHGKIQKAKSMIAYLDCGLEKIFERHMTNKSGKYIVFCANTERLQQAYDEASEWFCNVNSNVHKYAVHSQNAASEKEYAGFCNDTDTSALKLLFSVNMLNEGVHVEGIDGVIMLRATQSANVFYQQLGRALSCASGKCPVIFDIVNNFESGDTAKQYSEIMEIGRQYGKGGEYDIQFELYDYVRDIREILDGLRNSFEDSWEIVFEVLQEYLAEYGHFPEYFEEYHDYKIGMWCSNQRVLRNAGNLSDERISLLDSLGFIWDAKDERWMSSYHQAEHYKSKHGKFPARTDTSEEAGTIYRWIANQKQNFKNGTLSKERKKLLESVGILVKVKSSEDSWNENYALLTNFLQKNSRFPTTTDAQLNESVYAVYRWMLHQREAYKKGRLSQDRIEKLESIGFVWDVKRDLWNRQFELLEKFVEINHRPPNAKDKINGSGIGQWYLKQKKLIETGKLAPELSDKIQKLNILAISSYDVYNDSVWKKNYEALKKFMDEFHRPPYTDEIYHGIKLYQWLIQQKNRYNEGKLKREYVDKFIEIGIDISVFTSAKELPRPAWMSTYMEYKKFLETMHRQPSTREKKLYCWQAQMRKRYK